MFIKGKKKRKKEELCERERTLEAFLLANQMAKRERGRETQRRIHKWLIRCVGSMTAGVILNFSFNLN